jgi:hypothetical protein
MIPMIQNNCSLIKEDWLATCLYCTKSGLRCIGRFPPALASNFHSPPANGKQGLISEEMSQTLLTNNKQGNLD